MNTFIFIGRIARDPEVRYSQSGTAFARFSIALDRGKDKNGEDKGADFPSVVCFGKTAELVEKYCYKGMLLGVSGRVMTGSYEKDGSKVYTTDFAADRVEFLSKREDAKAETKAAGIPEGFSQLTDDDIPF